MNKDILQGNWKQFKGRVKEHWGQLTDDEVEQIEGHWQRLVGKLQERYGYSRQDAENAVEDFLENMDYQSERTS